MEVLNNTVNVLHSSNLMKIKEEPNTITTIYKEDMYTLFRVICDNKTSL